MHVWKKEEEKEISLEMSISLTRLTRTFLRYPHFPLFAVSYLVMLSTSSVFSYFFLFQFKNKFMRTKTRRGGDGERERENRLYNNLHGVSLE
jgi:hypothetical protein